MKFKIAAGNLCFTGQKIWHAIFIYPNETYLYVWQINLRDRSIVPLNKLSEALMQ